MECLLYIEMYCVSYKTVVAIELEVHMTDYSYVYIMANNDHEVNL